MSRYNIEYTYMFVFCEKWCHERSYDDVHLFSFRTRTLHTCEKLLLVSFFVFCFLFGCRWVSIMAQFWNTIYFAQQQQTESHSNLRETLQAKAYNFRYSNKTDKHLMWDNYLICIILSLFFMSMILHGQKMNLFVPHSNHNDNDYLRGSSHH